MAGQFGRDTMGDRSDEIDGHDGVPCVNKEKHEKNGQRRRQLQLRKKTKKHRRAKGSTKRWRVSRGTDFSMRSVTLFFHRILFFFFASTNFQMEEVFECVVRLIADVRRRNRRISSGTRFIFVRRRKQER